MTGVSAANKISPAYSPSAVVHSPAYTNHPSQNINNSGAKASFASYSPNLDICSPASPSRPGFSISKAISPADYSVTKSPYYIPPMNSSDKSVVSNSAGKIISSPDYNPASPGYIPSRAFIDLVDEDAIKEESDESD